MLWHKKLKNTLQIIVPKGFSTSCLSACLSEFGKGGGVVNMFKTNITYKQNKLTILNWMLGSTSVLIVSKMQLILTKYLTGG